MHNEHLAVTSEIHELEMLLASIPKANVIERLSLQSRLKSAQKALESLEQLPAAPKAKLTFRGRPVLGSHGISADFGAKAAGAFADAFSAITAALNETLGNAGPIPDKAKNQLLITGTAIGSFGFELELPRDTSLFPDSKQSEEAMKKIEMLFRTAATGSDDEIAEIVDEVHPRAVKKVYAFLDILVQQHAWCALEFDNRSFRYADYDQLKYSSVRLKDDNIKEETQSYKGEFIGVLPASRTFEFKLSDQEGVLRGKIDTSIDDPDVLNREWLHRPVTLSLNVVQVGNGRPRYTLKDLASIAS